jgi:3-carboxy-cis,cis-muconate cycloisomerase
VESVSRRAASDGADLKPAALADTRVRAVLGAEAIEAALDPLGYLGSADAFIDRALRRFEAAQSVGAGR